MPVRIAPDPEGLRGLVTRAEALRAGLSRGEVDHRVASGRWMAIRRGVMLTEPGALDTLDRFERSRALHAGSAVAAGLLRPESTVSHASAAVVHGLPLICAVGEAALTVPEGSWGGRRSGIHVRVADLAQGDGQPVDLRALAHLPGGRALARPDVRVTTLGRTWVDLAGVGALEDAVSAGDAALRRGEVTREHLVDRVAALPPGARRRRATAALDLLDARRETAIESLSSVRLAQWGLPAPQLQVEVWDEQGLIGRVDFLWPGLKVIGEADGRLKYRTPDDLYREKLREDRLRALGYVVVRWSWRDLIDPRSTLPARLAAALATAA